MRDLLFALVLFQVSTPTPGVVAGVIRGSNGEPAAGVRVFAISVRDAADAGGSPPPLESLTETDASGKYRLEIGAGRYYIASGAVGLPMYSPGTPNTSSARVVTVTAGERVEGVDISDFVPASRTPGIIGPATGVLSGVVRAPNGAPLSGVAVIAGQASRLTGGLVTLLFRGARTDNTGRYRIDNVPPDTYYIAAGFAEQPTLYPGTPDIAAAKLVTTTPTTNLATLDFVLPDIDTPGKTIVSGRVTGFSDSAAGGATVHLRSAPSSPAPLPLGLPTLRPPITTITARADGSFEFNGVFPGAYSVEANFPGEHSVSRNIVVGDRPVRDVALAMQVAVLSGRIAFEDGSPVPDVTAFGDAIVTTVDHPNRLSSPVLPVSSAGTFSRIIEPGEYRFYLRAAPDEYTIRSITSGAANLLKESLKVTGTERVDVDVRVAKRTATLESAGVAVSGTVMDAPSGSPTRVDRVTLCCLNSGPFERLSTPMRSDRSFAFAGVPAGNFTVGLQPVDGQPAPYIIPAKLNVASTPLSGLTFVSTPQLGQLEATILFEDGRPLGENSPALVVFTGKARLVRVVAERDRYGFYVASLPVGDQYTVSVENLPAGYAVKSATDSIEVRSQNYLGAALPTGPPIVITLAPVPGAPQR